MFESLGGHRALPALTLSAAFALLFSSAPSARGEMSCCKPQPAPVHAAHCSPDSEPAFLNLISILSLNDPSLLADTSLPRLSHLLPSQRNAVYSGIARWPIARRVAAIAFLQVGTPYALGPLGENKLPDTDPLIQFRRADCATVNLIAEALAHSKIASDEQACMVKANYRNGVVTFADRLHFTTDRLDVSPYDRDITRRVGGAGIKSKVVTLNRRIDGSKWIDIPWERERTVEYLPMKDAGDFAARFRARKIPEAMGVAFVQENKMKDGLDVVHESMLWQGRILLHGSSKIGRVTTISWSDFLRDRGGLYDGVVLFEYL